MVILVWRESLPDEQKKMVKKIAGFISKYDLEAASIFIFELVKPVAYVMGGMSRMFLAPFFILAGHDADVFLTTFEKRDNIEKLLELLENNMQQKKSSSKDV